MQVQFKGEWKDNIPYKNENSKSDVVTIMSHNNKKAFEGTIKKGENGSLYGYAKIYYWYLDDETILYEGNYRSPTLCTIIFCTWELELEVYKDFVPTF